MVYFVLFNEILSVLFLVELYRFWNKIETKKKLLLKIVSADILTFTLVIYGIPMFWRIIKRRIVLHFLIKQC